MTRLSASEKRSLHAHMSWDVWGRKFGFRLFGTNDEFFGHFKLPSGDDFVVSKEAREMIDAALTSEDRGCK